MKRLPSLAPPAFLGLGGLLVLGLVLFGTGSDRTYDAGVLEPMAAEAAEVVEVKALGHGQTFGGVLGRAAVPHAEQQRVLMAFQEQHSPGRLRVGTEFTFRYLRGDDQVRGIDVVVSPDEMVRLERADLGWRSSKLETPTWTDTIVVAGQIDRDLWSAVVLNPDLEAMPRGDRARVIDLMDRVFQWQLDFSRQIQRGDSYRLAFEREVRPDGTMRTGKILAAELVNRDTPLQAIWFDLHGDGEGGYYDAEGESLRRAFLKAPLEYRRISSRFNMNRLHPIHGDRRPHIGVDYAAPTGTPVMATSDGTVTFRGVRGGYGNLVEIRHSRGYLTRYAHLNGFNSSVRQGSRVSQGQVIGYVGMTGTATGPHLHYELHRNGNPVDPLDVDIPSGDPIPSEYMERWKAERDQRFTLLDAATQNRPLRMAEGEGLPGTSADGRSSQDQ
ncbi:MAG: M23 family metallopeptidase [Gemmatimonadales bacterium]|nr:MAG: M23 family metallopeptidase [Gemmatimonadales bacterium]